MIISPISMYVCVFVHNVLNAAVWVCCAGLVMLPVVVFTCDVDVLFETWKISVNLLRCNFVWCWGS